VRGWGDIARVCVAATPAAPCVAQTFDVLAKYYGSRKRCRRLAWDKAKKRSVFTQVLNAIAPNPQVWQCCVLLSSAICARASFGRCTGSPSFHCLAASALFVAPAFCVM
jgi:hypothetical protein